VTADDREGVWAAPGRVNLIGEHTDYNDGFVLPIALPQRVVVTARRRDDGVLNLRSRQEEAVVTVAVDGLAPGSVEGWGAYAAGVAWSLHAEGLPVGGADLDFDGNVPLGAGLSSSAALECATAVALTELYDVDVERPALAALCRRAENDYVGVPSGVMDQYASLLCTAGHALFLDTRSMRPEQVPLDLGAAGLALLVIDTRAPHRLVEGEYADRRSACEQAAEQLGVRALRDITAEELETALDKLGGEVQRRRVRHIVTENARVLEVVALLRDGGDPRRVGPLLSASHTSLREDYEVTSPELDEAVDAALAAGALGARMTGAGFGGCVIALVEAAGVDAVSAGVRERFAVRGFTAPEHFLAEPSSGATRLS